MEESFGGSGTTSGLESPPSVDQDLFRNDWLAKTPPQRIYLKNYEYDTVHVGRLADLDGITSSPPQCRSTHHPGVVWWVLLPS